LYEGLIEYPDLWRVLVDVFFQNTLCTLVDLLAVLPFFIFISNTSIDFRSLRVFRVLRILKFTRYSKTLNNLKNALKASQDELIISITLLLFMLIVSSTLIFFAEHNAQPETFSSIPASLWWSVITITTVGYGDVYPITVFGKIIAGVLAVSGIGLIAMPSGIFASELIFGAKKRKCSVCNATLNNSKK
jgi:voltage-gated potassium channel